MTPSPALLLGLTRRYTEPHRRFHTIRHVADMLWNGRTLDLSDEQVLAIWYHDAIYDVPAAGNERRSAALAVRELTAHGWPAERVKIVERIVLDTERHLPTIPESAPVIDLDLATLAGDWDDFQRNARAIRAEYALYDDDEFFAGQREVFEEFLGRERIYHTAFGARLEASARRNLARQIRERRPR